MDDRDKKYKAYDTEDKIMREPITLEQLIQWNRELQTSDQEHSLPYSDYITFAHNNTAWMQYTWVRDRNWKEIYRGDLLLYDNGCVKYIMEVKYRWGDVPYWGCYIGHCINGKQNHALAEDEIIEFELWLTCNYDIRTVVWNIYEHKHLTNNK